MPLIKMLFKNTTLTKNTIKQLKQVMDFLTQESKKEVID